MVAVQASRIFHKLSFFLPSACWPSVLSNDRSLHKTLFKCQTKKRHFFEYRTISSSSSSLLLLSGDFVTRKRVYARFFYNIRRKNFFREKSRRRHINSHWYTPNTTYFSGFSFNLFNLCLSATFFLSFNFQKHFFPLLNKTRVRIYTDFDISFSKA